MFIGCGGGGGSNGGNSDFIDDFLSNFPPLDTTGHALINEQKYLTYYDNSSAQLARDYNAAISANSDFGYDDEDYTDENEFWYSYSLRDPTSKDLNYAYTFAQAWQGSSYIGVVLGADRSIETDEFTEIFGEIDTDLLGAVTDTNYEGNMSAKFDEYYTSATASGAFFDNADCGTDGTSWYCHKDDGNVYYYFYFLVYIDYSHVFFRKELL
ncbi:MAG: hypothetical protein LBP40_04390 [Campylobacteraceae bacterium]|nr:hypothetical protein [Campylobacteraceae bacterium]